VWYYNNVRRDAKWLVRMRRRNSPLKISGGNFIPRTPDTDSTGVTRNIAQGSCEIFLKKFVKKP
jgi:hypothetical protein